MQNVETTRMSTLQEHTWLLREVIDTAKERVVISSPFISPGAIRYDNIPSRISRAVSRGVKVKVYVDDLFNREGDEVKQGAKEGVQILLQAGAEVYVVQGIHSKTLIRDSNLIAEGSFNWLSAVRREGHKHQRKESSIVQRGNVGQILEGAVVEMERMGVRIGDAPVVTEGAVDEREGMGEMAKVSDVHEKKNETVAYALFAVGAALWVFAFLSGDSETSFGLFFVGFLSFIAGLSVSGGATNSKSSYWDDYDARRRRADIDRQSWDNDPAAPGSSAWIADQVGKHGD